MAVRYLIKESTYIDSVSLMTISRELRDLPGIEDAALIMGTEANKNLLKQSDLFTPEMASATANDVIVVVKGEHKLLAQALERAEGLFSSRLIRTKAYGEHRPRTLRAAAHQRPDANLAVISTSGQHAAAEAWTALHHGLHVFLFSDHVSLVDEIALKREAIKKGLLMMGPAAGTAYINGVALGFANVVPRGPVGVVSAAGTGLQEVSSILAREGIGISQGIGVGGRDLSDSVGGLMMVHAVEALQEDPKTQLIIAISKLPSPKMVSKVIAQLRSYGKPSITIFMGGELISGRLETSDPLVYQASSLQEAALVAAALVRGDDPMVIQKHLTEERENLQDQAQGRAASLLSGQRYLRGLFSGGTLCEEAMRIWSKHLGPIWSNAPLQSEFRIADPHKSLEHTALDLGEEQFTLGRPHPMIDYEFRMRRLLQEAKDPSVALIQMDVVLGYGAHPDPAEELGPTIEQSRQIALQDGRELIVVLSITGTEGDPQNLHRQWVRFEEVGAVVFESNAAASWFAVSVVDSLRS